MVEASKTQHHFSLTFENPQDFDLQVERKGADTGFFFRTSREFSVGTRVVIAIVVKGVGSPVFLEGRVQWRRVRAGGPDLPEGVFVALLERERARLDGILSYLRSMGRKERRTKTRFPVQLRAFYLTSKGEFQAEVRNISEGGAFLRCEGPLLAIGARFPVTFFAEEKQDSGISIEVEVAWIDLFKETQGMGVLFVRGGSPMRKIRKLIDGYEKNINKPNN
jgi:Tfp pilus assembly protein PilZ